MNDNNDLAPRTAVDIKDSMAMAITVGCGDFTDTLAGSTAAIVLAVYLTIAYSEAWSAFAAALVRERPLGREAAQALRVTGEAFVEIVSEALREGAK